MRAFVVSSVVLMIGFCCCQFSLCQDAQVKQALGINPKHADIGEIDAPAEKDAEACTIESSSTSIKTPGWLVKDGSGRTIRLFLDTDGDNQLDQWSFFKNGLEVYRDIDSNGDKTTKPNEHRWMGSAGIRWGLDKDEDGTIDSWKIISGEEVAIEVFKAVQTKDEKRFLALLATDDELVSLKLGDKISGVVKTAIDKARSQFATFAAKQTKVDAKSRFVHFGSSRPSLAPAGTNGLTQDVVVYDHGSAVFEAGTELEQLSLGTLVQVGDAWRVLELPSVVDDTNPVIGGGLFFPLPGLGDPNAMGGISQATAELNELFETWQTIEEKLKDAKAGAATEKLQQERVDALYKLAMASNTTDDRRNWIRNLTDTALQAYQSGLFENAVKSLDGVATDLRKKDLASDTDVIAWGLASARYSRDFQKEGSERVKATERFMADLEKFIESYGDSEFAGEAMMQLALYYEVNSSNGGERALKLYERVAKEFKGTDMATRAAGAVTRLGSIGKAISFTGKSLAGRDFDLQDRKWRGKIVVINYWASWSANLDSDLDELQRLAAKYKDDLVLVGANLDEKQETVDAYLKTKPNVKWEQLFAEGGIEKSPLAWQLGVTAPPLIVLVDDEGKVVDTTLSVADLDREIQRLIRRRE